MCFSLQAYLNWDKELDLERNTNISPLNSMLGTVYVLGMELTHIYDFC